MDSLQMMNLDIWKLTQSTYCLASMLPLLACSSINLNLINRLGLSFMCFAIFLSRRIPKHIYGSGLNMPNCSFMTIMKNTCIWQLPVMSKPELSVIDWFSFY